MAHPATYFDLVEAFNLDGCPACRITQAGMDRYFDTLAYECLNDLDTRAGYRASLGFCAEHARTWMEGHRQLGTAIIYHDVLSQLAEELRQLTYRPRRVGLWQRLASWLKWRRDGGPLAPGQLCPACQMHAKEDDKAVYCLVQGIDEWEFEEAFLRSDGLCLPHLRQALQAAPDESAFATLVESALAGQEALRGQLETVMRHHAPEYRGIPMGQERWAADYAVRYVLGVACRETRQERHLPYGLGR